MNRRTFNKKLSFGLLFGLSSFSILSCTEENDPNVGTNNETDDSCVQNGTDSSISTNHGHSLVVSSNDVENGNEKQYTIQGSSDHNHTVLVSSSNFASLKNGQSISLTSSSGSNHTHKVTVSCA